MEPDDDKDVVISGNLQIGSLSVDTSSYYYNNGVSWTDGKATAIATKSDIDEVVDRLAKIEERLAILNDPDPKMLENYPALREAYDAYKLIEKLVEGKNDN